MIDPIIRAIEQRISINHFDPSRGIEDAEVEVLVGLATRAPTAFNLQNWRFIAVRTPDQKARLRQLAWNQPKVTEASVVFIVCGALANHAELPERLRPAVEVGLMSAELVQGWADAARGLYLDRPQAQRDEAVRTASLGAATLMFAAHARGLASAPMTGFDAAGVAQAFALGPNEVPVMLVAVGHAAPGNWPQKPRRPVADVLDFA
jgi:nitroreductase